MITYKKTIKYATETSLATDSVACEITDLGIQKCWFYYKHFFSLNQGDFPINYK